MFSPRRYLQRLGPGVITGASDDDPSGIATYAQTGARAGYRFLWLALFTTPLMIAVQEMSARLGIVSGQGLAALIRRHLSATAAVVVSFLLLIVNTINLGADLGALGEVTKLIAPGPAWAWVLGYAVLIIFLEVRLPYKRYVKVLQWLTVSLLAYVAVVFVVKVDWPAVAVGTLLPRFGSGREAWTLIVAILGTTISPYLFFWEASEEVEEQPKLAQPVTGHLNDALTRMRRDNRSGMIFSNLVMFFIITATAATLYQNGIHTITTAGQAAEVLRPVAGPLTFLLFSLGVIGAGLLAIPILAGSAAYAVSEVFGRPEGLSKTFTQARAFYGVIVVAILLGLVLTVLRIPPIQLLYAAAIMNGLLAPVVLWFILQLADRPAVVGEYRSGPVTRLLGWTTLALMTISVGLAGWFWLAGRM